MTRLPLTAVVPTLDEEANLGDCLKSAAFAAEAIVIDSGSRDRTVEIARDLGARVETRPFTGYGEQRNHGVSLASTDWVLCLDADERVTPALATEIAALFGDGLPPRPGYRLRREARFLGQVIRHGGWQKDRVLRLYDRRRGRWDHRLVHEKVELEGDPGDLAAPLEHWTARGFLAYADKSRRYAERGALELHRRGQRAGALSIGLLPASRFLKMYLLERGFLDGVPGLLIAALGAYGVFLKYARLWELARGGENGRGP